MDKRLDIRFSVVIPLYNKEKYIRRTLQSVLSQSYPFFEIIVVDDGSSDGSVAIVKSLKDDRIRLVEQSNAGVSAARNRGVQEANEQYVAFLDADDYWHVEYLHKVAELIRGYPEAGMYAARYAEVNNQMVRPFNLRVEEGFHQGYIDYFELYAKTFLSPICTSAVIVRKNVFMYSGGFPSGIRAGEDIMLWIKIATHEKIAYLNEVLAYYNNDVDVANRLSKKLYAPKENYIFSLSELRDEGKKSLVYLLDGLTVRTLRPYYALGLYPEATRKALRQVNFRTQPLVYRIYYRLPRWCAGYVYKSLRKIRSLLS